MAPQLTEIFQVKVNDKFHSDPSLFAQLREGAEKGGLKRQSFGFDLTNPSGLIWVLHFEQGKGPRDFVWPSAEYGHFMDRLNAIAASPLTSHFLPFESFPKAATSAPVTEIAIVTLKSSVNLEDARPILQKALDDVLNADGCVGGDWSLASDNLTAFYFIGWETVEHHIKYSQTDTFKKEQQVFGSVMEKGEAIHVTFSDHQSL